MRLSISSGFSNPDFLDDPAGAPPALSTSTRICRRGRSLELINKKPSAYQVRLLSAEALEAQGDMESAAKEYRQVLEMNLHPPGHTLPAGRFILSAPKTDTTMQDAERSSRRS